MPMLAELLLYKNEHVLNRYKIDYPHNKLTAEDALHELMKYFWLCLQHEQDQHLYPENDALKFICGIHDEMHEIDDMWHTFLLFTKDYMLFCENYIGQYFHHVPTAAEDKLNSSEFEMGLSRYLSYIYDNLGEETLLKWFN